MPNLLQNQLPLIIADGRRQVERIRAKAYLASMETREWVLPAKDSAILNWIKTDKRRRRMTPGLELQPNRLIHGSDLSVMAALLAEAETTRCASCKPDLVYLDIAFDREKCSHQEDAFPDMRLRRMDVALNSHEVHAVCDMTSYLGMLVPRLLLMWELSSDRGSICVRIDAEARNWIEMIIRDLFGRQCFVDQFPANRTSGTLIDGCSASDADSDAFLLIGKRTSDRSWHDLCPARARHIAPRCDQESSGAGFSFAAELDETLRTEAHLQDTAANIAEYGHEALCRNTAGSNSARLLSALILTSTNTDSIVADFSGGAGNTAAIAERLGRRWIASNSDDATCAAMRKQLIEQNADPFLYQVIPTHCENAAQSASRQRYGASDLAQIVLLIYGAEPLSSKAVADCNLGHMYQLGRRTLVMVARPDELIGLETLKKALRQCDTLPDKWERLVVLGWSFEPGIDAAIQTLDDTRVEVLTIPAELLEILNKNGNAGSLTGQVQFSKLSA
jgi:adenine-specific DNA-methyltransferase